MIPGHRLVPAEDEIVVTRGAEPDGPLLEDGVAAYRGPTRNFDTAAPHPESAIFIRKEKRIGPLGHSISSILRTSCGSASPTSRSSSVRPSTGCVRPGASSSR